MEAAGEGLEGATGESAARGGVLLNSACFISEVSMAGPLAAVAALPPDPIPVHMPSVRSGAVSDCSCFGQRICVCFADMEQEEQDRAEQGRAGQDRTGQDGPGQELGTLAVLATPYADVQHAVAVLPALLLFWMVCRAYDRSAGCLAGLCSAVTFCSNKILTFINRNTSKSMRSLL